MASLFPTYESYQARTERELPVVVVEPAAAGADLAIPPFGRLD
jgi:hypothetical protein